ncbi:MAG: molybdate ABC transporter substrate-binding protein [Thermodesulfobacteriota bacterium]
MHKNTPARLPVIPAERGQDLLGLEHADQADLVLFMAGNQFMAMPELLEAFQQAHPEVQHIFCETLPPKLELQQILAGGARFQEREITCPPEVYSSVSAGGVDALAQAGLTNREECFIYLHNRIVLMVPEDNPLNIMKVQDLAAEQVRISQPNPEYEDIAEHIINMYRRAGGEGLVQGIMEIKKQQGTTLLTTVHHRQTPERLLSGEADVGPVWATEVAHARRQGLKLAGVEVGPDLDQRDRVNYYACPISTGRNPQNGRAFLDFLRSPAAQEIFSRFGFTPHQA